MNVQMSVDVMALIKSLLMEEYPEGKVDEMLNKAKKSIEGDKITITYDSGVVEVFRLNIISLELKQPLN